MTSLATRPARAARFIAMVLAIAAAVCVMAGAGQSARAAPADEPSNERQGLVDWIVRMGAPGATLVIRDGDDLETYTRGVSDLESETPIEVTDRHRVGQVTITMITTLAMQLWDAGALDLDSPAATYAPDVIPDRYADVTVRQLMNHTSGIKDYRDARGFWEHLWSGERFHPRQLARFGLRSAPQFPPGTEYQFSISNPVVLAMVVRAVGDDTVRAQLKDRIFEPLGLGDTSFPLASHKIEGPHVRGYVRSGGGEMEDMTEYYSISWAWASGAVVSTPVDVSRFFAGLMGGELVSAEALDEMTTVFPDGDDYGLGMFRIAWGAPCGPVWGHDGVVFGYGTFALSSRDGSRQVVVTINVDVRNGQPPPDVFWRVWDALYKGYCDLPVGAPSLPPPPGATALSTRAGGTPDSLSVRRSARRRSSA